MTTSNDELSWEEVEAIQNCFGKSSQVRGLMVALFRQLPTLDREQFVRDMNDTREVIRRKNL